MLKLFILFLFVNYAVLAQIHTKNQKFVEVEAGALDGLSFGKADNSGRWLNLIIGKYGSQGVFFSLSAAYSEKFYKPNVQLLLTNQLFFLNGIVGRGISFIPKKKVFLNIEVGPSFGYELINKGDYLIDSDLEIVNRSKILVGGIFKTNLEFLLGVKFSVLAKTGLVWFPTSSVQNTHLYTGLGLRYIYF